MLLQLSYIPETNSEGSVMKLINLGNKPNIHFSSHKVNYA